MRRAVKHGIVRAMRWVAFVSLLVACGQPALPKGPPPEYEEEPGMASAAPADAAAPTTPVDQGGDRDAR